MTRTLRSCARAARATLLVTFAIASPGISQVRPVGAPSMSPEAIQDRLGPCPVEELREAWSGMEAVERAAVEQEVIRLCTERAVLVGEFLAAHRDLRAALGELVPELPTLAASRAEETASVAVPGEGAGASIDAGPNPATGSSTPASFQSAGSAAPSGNPSGLEGGPFGRFADSLGLEPDDGPNLPGDPASNAEHRDLPPPGTIAPDVSVMQAGAPVEGAAAPPVPEPSWEVLFTARRSDGAWLAMIRETDPPPLVLPALAPAEGDDPAVQPPVLAPRPPESALVSEGERLAAGGPVVMRIGKAGVELVPDSGGDTVVLPWASGAPAIEPGRPDFLYVKEGD